MIAIGPFHLSLEHHELSRDGAQIPLRPQAFKLLAYLSAHPGRLVTKSELLAQLWPKRVVEEAAVKVAVRELRKALGDDAREPSIIRTVHRCGYKLIAPVTAVAGSREGTRAVSTDSTQPRLPVNIDQKIRFATTPGGVRWSRGAGPGNRESTSRAAEVFCDAMPKAGFVAVEATGNGGK